MKFVEIKSLLRRYDACFNPLSTFTINVNNIDYLKEIEQKVEQHYANESLKYYVGVITMISIGSGFFYYAGSVKDFLNEINSADNLITKP